MKRFPLYAKILLWFFLNLVLLGVAFWLFFGTQFRFRPEWLLAGSAEERIESLTDVMLAELNESPRSHWDGVLERFHQAYQLQFLVFRDDGVQLAGDAIALPPEVRIRLVEPRRLLRGPLPQEEPGRPFHPLQEPGSGERPSPDRPPLGMRPRQDFSRLAGTPAFIRPGALLDGGPRPKIVVRTSAPVRYWLLVRAALADPVHGRPAPATLVAVSKSLSGGGLFFDFRPWVAAGAGAMVLSALFWFPLVRGITRSLSQATRAARQIAEGRFDVRVDEQRRDELGELGQSINQMAGRLGSLVRGQKRFLGDIAHELCSPLAKLRVALGILEQRADDEQKPYVNSANEKAEQISQLVHELLSFSKAALGASKPKLEPVCAREAAESALQREAPPGHSIQLNVPADLWVLAEPELLARALANLLRNALRYAGQAGPIVVSGHRLGHEVELRVADSGPGVSEDDLPKLFDPFYRVDTSRDRATGGVGLGLAIVKTCIESCGGTVACRNRKPGLEFTIRLAAAAQEIPGTGQQRAARPVLAS
jgi:two-component system sensor histidine kinase CpxA